MKGITKSYIEVWLECHGLFSNCLKQKKKHTIFNSLQKANDATLTDHRSTAGKSNGHDSKNTYKI